MYFFVFSRASTKIKKMACQLWSLKLFDKKTLHLVTLKIQECGNVKRNRARDPGTVEVGSGSNKKKKRVRPEKMYGTVKELSTVSQHRLKQEKFRKKLKEPVLVSRLLLSSIFTADF